MGSPNMVVCLDSVASTPDQLSITSSLRGYLGIINVDSKIIIDFDLKVRVADNNMHSGIASGICPNPFQIMMTLLQRLQDFQS